MTPDYVEGKSQEYRPGPGIYIIGGIIFAFNNREVSAR